MPLSAGIPPERSPSASTQPAMPQESAKKRIARRRNLRCPPKAMAASKNPAASFPGQAAIHPSPGRKTAAA